jgi:transcriptional regulator with XRE-family HTH domain
LPKPPKEVVLAKDRIGARIKVLREQRGLSQGKLAALLNSHPQSISQVERGVRGLTLQQVVKLARALKISTDEILGETKRGVVALNGDRKLVRRLQRIQQLEPAQKKAVLKLLDSALGISQAGARP